MAEIAATTSHETDDGRLENRYRGRKWSRQTSTLAIIGLSLLGWLVVGGALQQVLSL